MELLEIERRMSASTPWFSTFVPRSLQIPEEIVVELLRGQGGHRETAAVVVERRVDDEPRAVAGLLSRADVLEPGNSVEPLSEDLGEGPGGEAPMDPPERQELALDQGCLKILAEIASVLREEGPVGVGRGAVRLEEDRAWKAPVWT